MEQSLLTYILLAVIGVLGYALIDAKFFTPEEIRTQTDTVYVDKPFKVETISRADAIIPETVTIWQTTFQPIQALTLVGDTVKVYVDTTESQPLLYDSRFLTAFPFAPKFLNLSVSSGRLSFTGLSPSGQTQTDQWPLDVSRHDYRLAPDGAGWVNLESDRAAGFLGLNLDFSHSIGVGSRWRLETGGLVQGGYLKYNPVLQLKQGFNVEGNILLSRNPTGMVGIEYEF